MENDNICCGNCLWFNGEMEETMPQFCDEKEVYVNAKSCCPKHRKRNDSEVDDK